MALQRATDSQPVVGDCILDGVGGRRCCDAFRVVKLDEIASGADLGGSSKYSNENIEGRSGEGFHVNRICTWVSRP